MVPIFAGTLRRLEEMHLEYFDYMDGLSTEELDWSPGPEMNSLCVLGVHVTAAERFWIGLGIDEVIERNRAAEFQASGFELEALKARFVANLAVLPGSRLQGQDGDRLAEVVDVSHYMERPSQLVSRGYALLRGLDHTAEHLGHAGMTRQLLDLALAQAFSAKLLKASIVWRVCFLNILLGMKSDMSRIMPWKRKSESSTQRVVSP